MPATPVTIVGTVTRDPSLTLTPSGAIALTLHITSDATGNAPGSPYIVTAWRNLAENAAETLQRGTRVIATGQLHITTHTTDQTTRTYATIAAHAIGPDLRYATARIHPTRQRQRDAERPNGTPQGHKTTPTSGAHAPAAQPHPKPKPTPPRGAQARQRPIARNAPPANTDTERNTTRDAERTAATHEHEHAHAADLAPTNQTDHAPHQNPGRSASTRTLGHYTPRQPA